MEYIVSIDVDNGMKEEEEEKKEEEILIYFLLQRLARRRSKPRSIWVHPMNYERNNKGK